MDCKNQAHIVLLSNCYYFLFYINSTIVFSQFIFRTASQFPISVFPLISAQRKRSDYANDSTQPSCVNELSLMHNIVASRTILLSRIQQFYSYLSARSRDNWFGIANFAILATILWAYNIILLSRSFPLLITRINENFLNRPFIW